MSDLREENETELTPIQKQYYFFAFNDLIVCCGKREPEKASKGTRVVCVVCACEAARVGPRALAVD